MKKWLLKPPQGGDILRLLQAWRVWVGGAVLGAVIAALIYILAPPPYRACATVLIDHNLEEVLPHDIPDREVFYYLQRETDKLVEVAWADSTLEKVSVETGLPIPELRDAILRLGQPGDGGWHFYADSPDAAVASAIAASWAGSFYAALQQPGVGVSPALQSDLSQVEALPVERGISLGVYIFAGSFIGIIILACFLLFFDRKDA